MEWNVVVALCTCASVILAIIAGQWRLSDFINTGFSKVYERVDKFKTDVLDKLEYHERHDDERFEEIRRDLFTIQLRSAADPKWQEKIPPVYLPNGKNAGFVQNNL